MFFGSIPALVTPFSNGRVSEDTFAEFVEWQIAEGSDGLVPCGTTGSVDGGFGCGWTSVEVAGAATAAAPIRRVRDSAVP